MHELFEDRVGEHPDAVAAVHADRQWTYAELDAQANRLARALVARGLARESVVAVVTARNLDWLAAVIAVFKAGGAYLPVEPHFPAGTHRRHALPRRMHPGADQNRQHHHPRPGPRLPSGTERLLVDTAYAEDHPDGDLGIPVTPDQLAYVYFTSGSTGEPKGAMCEHAGMLNHLYAKIDDLHVGEGHVVAQTAPSASTSPCGSWSARCWSAGGPCWCARTSSSTYPASSTPSPTARSPSSRSCRPTSKPS